MKKKPQAKLSHEACNRLIEMAWEDRTPFEAIHAQFGITIAQLPRIMRELLSEKAFIRWRKRVSQRTTKHAKLRSPDISRHHAPGHRRLYRR